MAPLILSVKNPLITGLYKKRGAHPFRYFLMDARGILSDPTLKLRSHGPL